jgi:hypothetical protein
MKQVSPSCFADDLTGFPKDQEELLKMQRLIDEFRPISGLAINKEKSEIMELGMDSGNCGLKSKG